MALARRSEHAHAASAAACGACGHPLEQVLDGEAMQALDRRTHAFHAARLRSGRREELEERARFTQDAAASVLGCGGCGLLVRWPVPGADELLRTHARERYSEERLAEMTASLRAVHRRQVPVLRRLLGEGMPRVVEVGSFTGAFLDVARTAGWRAVGVDPNHQLADRARERGLAVFEGTLEALASCVKASARADAVVIWNTFDQLVDPDPVSTGAARLLRIGGILAVRVPHGLAFRALHARWVRARGAQRRLLEASLAWNNLLSFPYARGYGVESLDRVIAPAGFRRILVRGDVLGALAGRATRGFARLEERAVKQWMAARIARQAREPASLLPAAPWLEVYYRRVGSALVP